MTGSSVPEGRPSGNGGPPFPVDRTYRIKDNMFYEHIKGLRAKLDSRMAGDPNNVFAVTSAVAGEGKTLVAVNLALHFASSGGKKVLLIDADLRKADVSDYFRIPRAVGLSELLLAKIPQNSVFRQSPHPNLAIVTTGNMVGDPADLLSGDAFRDFLAAMRTQFDTVILDAPPVLPVADTLGLRDRVGGFLLVFRAGFTPYTELHNAVEEIGEKSIIGVVFNGVNPKNPRYYEKYYGRYYQRPSEDKD